MIDRIKKLMELKNLSSTQFSDEIGIQRSSLSHVLSGRNKPSLDFMLKIKVRFPDASLDWLLLGNGEMFSEDRDEASNFRNVEQIEAEESFSKDNISQTRENQEEEPGTFKSEQQVKHQKKGEYSIKMPEKVIVFYDDQTFNIYHPNKEKG